MIEKDQPANPEQSTTEVSGFTNPDLEESLKKRFFFEFDADLAEAAKEVLEKVKNKEHVDGLFSQSKQIENFFKRGEFRDYPDFTDDGKNKLVREKGGMIALKNVPFGDMQKSLIRSTLTQVLKKLAQGASVHSGLNLPIFMFMPRTYLQMSSRGLAFLPSILAEAMKTKDPLKRLQFIVAQITLSQNFNISYNQPINPIIGETFTCKMGEATLFAEQISHHPPVGSYYIKGPGYTVNGRFEGKPSISLSQVKVNIIGFTKIVFEDTGDVFKWELPNFRIKGIMSGAKKFIVEDYGYIYSEKRNWLCVIHYSPGGGGVMRIMGGFNDRDEVIGEAFSVHPDTLKQFLSKKKPRPNPGLKDGKKLAKRLFKIKGKWTEKVKIGDMEVTPKTFRPVLPHSVSDCLPSDSVFRKDVLYMLTGDLDTAAKEKRDLEEIQRADRKLRAEFKKNNK